jgi:two-component system alkaline phosphatase synthesis response regulator PhoP
VPFITYPHTATGVLVTTVNQTRALILVVEDVHEIRYGMEKLLMADGYRVCLARDEEDAIEVVQQRRPNLILVSLPGSPNEVSLAATRIRGKVDAAEQVPVVIFCVEGIAEGDEIAIGENIHLTLPDNFNQLRGLLSRVLTRVNEPAA